MNFVRYVRVLDMSTPCCKTAPRMYNIFIDDWTDQVIAVISEKKKGSTTIAFILMNGNKTKSAEWSKLNIFFCRFAWLSVHSPMRISHVFKIRDGSSKSEAASQGTKRAFSADSESVSARSAYLGVGLWLTRRKTAAGIGIYIRHAIYCEGSKLRRPPPPASPHSSIENSYHAVSSSYTPPVTEYISSQHRSSHRCTYLAFK